MYILEDDYLADFDRNKKRDPLFSYDINEKVIYLKSYSKILFPGLRIGAVVVPDQLRDPFSMFKKASDIDSAMFSQAALELYINNGMYDHHLKKIREIYYQKTELFKKTVKNHKISGKLNLSPPLAMKTHLTMPDHLAMKSLVKRLNEKKVWIDSSDSNYHLLQNRDRDNHLFIELSNTRTDCIEEGTNLLLNEIENMLRL